MSMEKISIEVPIALQNLAAKRTVAIGGSASNGILTLESCAHQKKTSLRVGVVLSGGPAPGGHNVIWGLLDSLEEVANNVCLLGFLKGPMGLLKNEFKILDKNFLQPFCNSGGFHMLGTGRTKINSVDQLERVYEVCVLHDLDGLVIIGGDDSNTNAWHLAEFFRQKNSKIAIIGVPKTIDGDLQYHPWLEVSFGFHTATQVYSYLVSNLIQDTASGQKYYHFVRLMGRSASHITLEVALQSHPTVALISEAIESQSLSLKELVSKIADVIVERSLDGKNFGVILIPEGLLEFIADFKNLISDLDRIYARSEKELDIHANFMKELPEDSLRLFTELPLSIQHELCFERDNHGNLQLSKIETEKFLANLTAAELEKRKIKNQYPGKFTTLAHFFGYEARAAPPSYFDANYAYALGMNAGVLIRDSQTGYLSCVKNLKKSVSDWIPIGLPIGHLMEVVHRQGKNLKVIRKALVDVTSLAHLEWSHMDPILGKKTLQQCCDERRTNLFSWGVSYLSDISNRPLLLPGNFPSTLLQDRDPNS